MNNCPPSPDSTKTLLASPDEMFRHRSPLLHVTSSDNITKPSGTSNTLTFLSLHFISLIPIHFILVSLGGKAIVSHQPHPRLIWLGSKDSKAGRSFSHPPCSSSPCPVGENRSFSHFPSHPSKVTQTTTKPSHPCTTPHPISSP